MTEDQLLQTVRMLSFVEWARIVGWAAAGVFFLLGIWMLLKEPPRVKGSVPDPWVEWYRRWQSPITGIAFLVFGGWATGGSGVMVGLRKSLITLLVFGYVAVRFWWGFKGWLRFAPMPGGRFLLYDGREMFVTEVGGKNDPDIFGTVHARFADGSTVRVSSLRFYFMAEPVKEE